MLAISTDMQTPKDIDVVSVFITTDGAPRFNYLGRVLPDGTVALPATIAIVEPQSPGARVRIRVVGFREASARVLRDVVTTVPHGQTALLRLPLSFLDDGSATGTIPANLVPLGPGGAPEGDTTFDPTDPTRITSRCDFAKGLTSVHGKCASAAVDSSKLPAYAAGEVYGDGGLQASGAPTSCFDVQTCFQGATPAANVDTRACSFPLPPGVDPATLNLALATPTTGACLASGPCYVPLVNDASDGWTVQGSTVTMPAGVCAKLGGGVTLAVSSGACAAEAASEPVCEPTGADAGGSPRDATMQPDVASDASAGSDGADAGSPDASCGNVPMLHAMSAGTLYCGVTDGGQLTCPTGQECCLGGVLGVGAWVDNQCAAYGSPCTNAGNPDAGARAAAIGVACLQVSDCAANGVSGAVACCLQGATEAVPAGCSYPRATRGSAIVCETTACAPAK
jgi:hypothetical protein